MENNYRDTKLRVSWIPTYKPVRVNYNGQGTFTVSVPEYSNGHKLRSSYPRQFEHHLDANAFLAVKDAFAKWEGKFLETPEIKSMYATPDGFVFLVGNRSEWFPRGDLGSV